VRGERDRPRLHVFTSGSCNNNCLFCLDDRAARREIDPSDAENQLVANRHLKSVLFTCGEPTLHPDLVQLIGRSRELGYEDVRVVTNGRRLAYPDYTRRLVAAGLTGITVSLHGPDAETHDRVVRTPGAFAQTWQALEHLATLRAEGIALELTTSSVIQKHTLPRVGDLLARLAQVGPDVSVLNVVQPLGEALVHFEATVLPYREIVAGLRSALVDGERPREVAIEGLPWCLSPELRSHLGQREEIVVRHDGDERTLDRHRNQIHGPPCQTCAVADACGGVFEAYVERFGWGEFSPLVDRAVVDRGDTGCELP